VEVGQGRREGGKGGIIPSAPKIPNNAANTFLNTMNLLPKDVRFEHGGAKLASCPGRHLTSLRPWAWLSQCRTETDFSKWVGQNIVY